MPERVGPHTLDNLRQRTWTSCSSCLPAVPKPPAMVSLLFFPSKASKLIAEEGVIRTVRSISRILAPLGQARSTSSGMSTRRMPRLPSCIKRTPFQRDDREARVNNAGRRVTPPPSSRGARPGEVDGRSQQLRLRGLFTSMSRCLFPGFRLCLFFGFRAACGQEKTVLPRVAVWLRHEGGSVIFPQSKST
jgi:hypothetical protein